MSVQPIRPENVVKLKQQIIPDFVLEAFNEEIARKWNDREAVVFQDEVVERIKTKMPVTEVNDVAVFGKFDNNWLDVEPIYRDAGWSVEYDKPAYCETYRAFFTFKRKRS